MSEERRTELAALSFTEKIKILEMLRERSLILAEARKKLLEQKKQRIQSEFHQPQPEAKG